MLDARRAAPILRTPSRAALVRDHASSRHPIAIARWATRRRAAGAAEAGFTLIELIVVVAILPIVVGGISVALLSVFGLQSQTTNRIQDSNDELTASANFNRDVQSAQELTTQATPGCGAATQTQVLGLEWGSNSSAPGGYQTVVSYVSASVVNQQAATTTYSMLRQVCTSGSSTTPTSTSIVARDIGNTPTLATGTPCPTSPSASTLCITGAATQQGGALPNISGNFSTWTTAQNVTGITFTIVATGSSYTYSLVGLPGQSTSQGFASSLQSASGPGCNFATAGSGTYATHLCFADFTGFNASDLAYQYGTGCDLMKRPIAGTPYTLQFCLAVNSSSVAPAAIPTYYNPGTNDSEAFLGNNGFYTGIAGNPALYTTTSGPVTAWFTQIQVLDSAGNPATGWTLVTGDAESTDGGEWNVYTSNLDWSILPNNGPSDLWGNACYDTNDTNSYGGVMQYTGNGNAAATSALIAADRAPLSINSTTYATGVSSIFCEASGSLNKTGTLMLQAQEPPSSSAAQTLTVTMNGAGLQAMFLGVLL
jgi:prepilin-type N-terminal cleavage/methylation domain-containing protein